MWVKKKNLSLLSSAPLSLLRSATTQLWRTPAAPPPPFPPSLRHHHSLFQPLSLSLTSSLSLYGLRSFFLVASSQPSSINHSSPPFSHMCHPAMFRQQRNGGLQLVSRWDAGVSSRRSACSGGAAPVKGDDLLRVVATTLPKILNSSSLSQSHLSFATKVPRSSARFSVEKQQILHVDPSQTESYFKVMISNSYFCQKILSNNI